MAADALCEPASVAATYDSLQAMLRKAREIKQVQTIEPPLPVADLVQYVSALDEGAIKGAEPHRFSVIEASARIIFREIVSSIRIDTPGFVRMWDLLDLLILCASYGKCDSSLAFWLIEELLDSQPTSGCRIVFDYLESRRERLTRKDFNKVHLILLRACNELLRRLSRAEDAVFCGRVFFFLFQTFPLGDKSSVNLRGEYHTDNITTYESDPQHGDSPDAMDVSEASAKVTEGGQGPENSASNGEKKSADVDQKKDETHKLYPVFWRMQTDFSEPIRLFNESNFVQFKSGLERTLEKFKQTPVVHTKATIEPQRGLKRKHGDDGGDRYANNYNPKYLTSRELFELELSDLSFQRHILVQGLILIDFLLSLTDKTKKKLSDLGTDADKQVNRSLLYSYTLSGEQETWVLKVRKDIANYLQEGPDGKYYYRMVETVLSRDKNWVRWKLESCPSIVKDATSPEEHAEARAAARQATTNRRIKARPMGAIDVTFLNEADNVKGLEKLKDPSRFSAPSIENLVKWVQNDELDLEMAMTDEETHSLEARIGSKTWRALRTATQQSLALLDRVEPGKKLEDILKHEEHKDDGSEETQGEEIQDGQNPHNAAGANPPGEAAESQQTAPHNVASDLGEGEVDGKIRTEQIAG